MSKSHEYLKSRNIVVNFIVTTKNGGSISLAILLDEFSEQENAEKTLRILDLKSELALQNKKVELNYKAGMASEQENRNKSIRISELEDGLSELWRQLVKSGDDINIATVTKDKVKNLISNKNSKSEFTTCKTCLNWSACTNSEKCLLVNK